MVHKELLDKQLYWFRIDSLITKGSVELAKEHIILERKFEESQQRIQILEETLIHQRELNMRNLRWI